MCDFTELLSVEEKTCVVIDDFEFEKSFELTENGLEVVFKITAKQGMPFMLGYHPAFKLSSTKPIINANGTEITIPEVMAVGSRAYQVINCEKIVLQDQKSLEISTTGFGSFMLWTEVTNMVCIEPITFYPYAVSQDNLDAGFEQLIADSKTFKVFLKPVLVSVSCVFPYTISLKRPCWSCMAIPFGVVTLKSASFVGPIIGNISVSEFRQPGLPFWCINS